MVRNRLRMRLVGRPGDAAFYPVFLTASATANRDRGARRQRFFLRHIEIGLQDLSKLMAKSVPVVPTASSDSPSPASRPAAAESAVRRHEDADFAVVNVGIGMKFPDIFPTDYAMCEVRLDVSFVARRGDELEESKRMFERIGPHVQAVLGDIARAAGGTTPFVDATAAAAAHGAETKVG